jgi:hypothetical protein
MEWTQYPINQLTLSKTHQTSNPPEETFYKPGSADWEDPQYYQVFSDTVWLTRQNNNPIYNYKYYLDTYGRDATSGELYDDFWYLNGGQGGTHGVYWAMLNDKWATADEKPYLNSTLFGKIGGYPKNYYSFKAIAGMVRDAQRERLCMCDFSTKLWPTSTSAGEPSGQQHRHPAALRAYGMCERFRMRVVDPPKRHAQSADFPPVSGRRGPGRVHPVGEAVLQVHNHPLGAFCDLFYVGFLCVSSASSIPGLV